MANGIPQLMTPPASSAFKSAITLAQGAIWDYLSTDVKWGIYYAGTSYPVILGTVKPSSISGVLNQATSLSGVKSLLNGQLVSTEVTIDSVVALNQRKGSELSNYRVETGSFATFNKVEKPRQIQVRLTKGGTEEERGMFLRWLDTRARGYTDELTRYPRKLQKVTLANKLKVNGSEKEITLNQIPTKMNQNNFFDIYVPEVHYTNMTLVDYTVTRESRSGANLIIANCTFQEVRQVTFQYSTTSTSNSKNAQDQSVETSAVQANEPSPDAISKVRGLIGI